MAQMRIPHHQQTDPVQNERQPALSEKQDCSGNPGPLLRDLFERYELST